MADIILLSTDEAEMIDYPLAIQATGGDDPIEYSAQNHMRALIDANWSTQGYVGFSALKVIQRDSPTWGVSIMPGYYVIDGDTVSDQGKYLVRLTGTINMDTPSAPVSGTRTHRLVAEVLDKQVSGTEYGWRLRLIEDTGSGLPAAPDNAATLAVVSISAGQSNITTSNITDSRTRAMSPDYIPVVHRYHGDELASATFSNTDAPSSVGPTGTGYYQSSYGTITKAFTDTALEVTLHTAMYGTESDSKWEIGCWLDGAPHIIGYFHCDTASVVTPVTVSNVIGKSKAAANYVVEIYFRRTVGDGSLLVNYGGEFVGTGGYFDFTVREVWDEAI